MARINQVIVRSAEEVVFFRDDHDWVFDFGKRNAAFRVETAVAKVPNALGIVCHQEIADTRS